MPLVASMRMAFSDGRGENECVRTLLTLEEGGCHSWAAISDWTPRGHAARDSRAPPFVLGGKEPCELPRKVG